MSDCEHEINPRSLTDTYGSSCLKCRARMGCIFCGGMRGDGQHQPSEGGGLKCLRLCDHGNLPSYCCQCLRTERDKALAENAAMRLLLQRIAEYEPDWTKGVAENVNALQAIAEAAMPQGPT